MGKGSRTRRDFWVNTMFWDKRHATVLDAGGEEHKAPLLGLLILEREQPAFGLYMEEENDDKTRGGLVYIGD